MKRMSNEEAINHLKTVVKIAIDNGYDSDIVDAVAIAINAIEYNPTGWIPIKIRPLTEAEKEEYKSEGFDDIEVMYDECSLPDDGQEVLVTTRYDDVVLDTFYTDDGCYFESYCDADDVKAWMPLPDPYKSQGSEKWVNLAEEIIPILDQQEE